MRPMDIDRLLESPGFPAALREAILRQRAAEGRKASTPAEVPAIRTPEDPPPAPVITDPLEAVRAAYRDTQQAIRALRAMASAGDEVARERIAELEVDLAKLEAQGRELAGGGK